MSGKAAANGPEPRVLVSVLSYGDLPSLSESVASLRAQTYASYELMIVDNFTTTAHRAAIRERYPDLVVLETDANLGFGGGSNLALRYGLAKGFDYVLACNDDVWLGPDSLARLVAGAERSPNLGVLGAIEMEQTGHRALSCGGDLLWWLGRVHWRSRPRPAGRDGLSEVFTAQGALLLFSRVALEQGVLLDERLFLYCEELDLGYQLRRRDLAARVCPDVRYRHRVGGNRSPRGLDVGKAFYIARNRVLVARRHLRLPAYAVFVLMYTLELVPKVIWRLVRSPKGFVSATLRGAWDGLRGAPLP